MLAKAFSAAFLLLLAAVQRSLEAVRLQQYRTVSGSLCISAEFVQKHLSERSLVGCAAMCSRSERCQAFTMADGPCQLFVFDKCSKSVRDCSCSRRGRLHVKRQPGLSAGALCPSGYGDELCGVKYRVLMNVGVWPVQKQRCESQPGLVIMADVMDSVEMGHVSQLFAKYGSVDFYLGGWQLPGSAEPAGGWVWASCNSSVDGSLWWSGEPNNGAGNENIGMRVGGLPKLVDVRHFIHRRALCECLSPFD